MQFRIELLLSPHIFKSLLLINVYFFLQNFAEIQKLFISLTSFNRVNTIFFDY
jgi:hypothetical protein